MTFIEQETSGAESLLIALYDTDSLPVRTLHAVLKRAGVAVRTLFFKSMNINNTMSPPTEKEIRLLVEFVRRINPGFVGISLRSTHFKLACRITAEIKKAAGETFVVWGGVHPTICPDKCLEFADAVCVGEGEEAVAGLARVIANHESPTEIGNLWIRNGEKTIKCEMRPLISDLDTLPFPDFTNTDMFFLSGDGIKPMPGPGERTSYMIMTSRGCPFGCTYCCNNILRDIYKGKGGFLRRRSPENVIVELKEARKTFPNLSFITFEDDVFTFNREWLGKFGSMYRREINLPFFCYCHPEYADAETIRLLKEAGLAKTTMGIQSGAEKVRRELYKRNETNEEIIRAARILREYNIETAYDLILDNPLETEEDRAETFRLLIEIPRPYELHTHTLTHFPRTKLTELLIEKGVITKADIEDEKQMSYERWTPALDLSRDRANLFWDCIYYMAKKRYIPSALVEVAAQNRFLRRHPLVLAIPLRITSTYVYTIRRDSKFDDFRFRIMGKLFARIKRLLRAFRR